MSVFGAGVTTPFREKIIRRPRFSGRKEHVEIRDNEDDVINAPRAILLGRLLDKETGEDKGPFWLPIDDLSHEPSMVIQGGSGSGKSVCLARIVSEMVLTFRRSAVICDFKGQYYVMSEPNKNDRHIEILEEFGEQPVGMGDIDVWLPNHIVLRNGEEYCRLKYNYNKTYTIRTRDMDAGGLLLLGGKQTEGKDYVMLFDTLLSSLRRAEREGMGDYTLEAIQIELDHIKRTIDGTKRSVQVLEIMLNNLITSGVIADNGNTILEMIDKPKKSGVGRISVFNTGAAGPNDVMSSGVLANLMNALIESLKTEFEPWKGTYINAYRPLFFVDETSTYVNRESSGLIMSTFNLLQYVEGRTLGICRGYVYQHDNQIPKGLKDSDTLPIFIKLQQSLPLIDEDGNKIGEMNKPGLAIVSIKNVGFMQNQDFYVQVLPPKCNVKS